MGKDSHNNKRDNQLRAYWRTMRKRVLWLKIAEHWKNDFRSKTQIQKCKERLFKQFSNTVYRRLQIKRVRKDIWKQRIAANAKLYGLHYNDVIHRLRVHNIRIDRKNLSQLAIFDRNVFQNIIDVAVPNWRMIKALRDRKPRKATVQQIDQEVFSYLERTYPVLYTHENVRFNRKVTKDDVTYTVDIGEPERWREQIARNPELANFEIPDHWITNAATEYSQTRLDILNPPEWIERQNWKKEQEQWAQVLKQSQEEEDAGGKNPQFKKRAEPLSRDAWFEKKPQSWWD